MVAAATALMAPVPHASEHRPYLAPRAFCAVNDAFRLPPPTQWAADPGTGTVPAQASREPPGRPRNVCLRPKVVRVWERGSVPVLGRELKP